MIAHAAHVAHGAAQHAADIVGPDELWRAWPWSPGSILTLGGAAVAWVVADRRAGHPGGGGWWWSALAVLAVALLSPLDTISESLLSFHMTQHLLLGLVAPLLLVRARPLRVLSHLLHPAPRRDVARFGAGIRRAPWAAGAVVVAHVGVWWAWHLPPLYDAAVHHELVHLTEHVSLFAVGLGLWGLAWPAGPVRQRGGASVLVVFLAAFGTGALAALLTLSTRAHFATDAATAQAWGLDRVSDQQLSGALMWVPGGFVYLGVGVALFAGWLAGRAARDPGLTPDRVVLTDR